jgi:hypothetical protein
MRKAHGVGVTKFCILSPVFCILSADSRLLTPDSCIPPPGATLCSPFGRQR